MGPFRIIENPNKKYNDFHIIDRWSEYAASVPSRHAGQAWIRDYYHRLELEYAFFAALADTHAEELHREAA